MNLATYRDPFATDVSITRADLIEQEEMDEKNNVNYEIAKKSSLHTQTN